MAEHIYSPQMAVKVKTVVPENGELVLELPFVAGREVEIFVVAEGLPMYREPMAHGIAPDNLLPTAQVTGEDTTDSGENVDPRRVSEVLRELSDELISRYEMLFRVERKPNDIPPGTE